MPTPLVECVPNFSEGRRSEVVDAIAEAVRATPGVLLLDRTSDGDHNRSVLTFVSDPQGIEDAAFAAIAKAAELIDMTQQQGEHPRIGATDVVPFVPIAGVSIDDCVAIANRLGKRIGEQLDIPVYLYEKAAVRPERENLADVRKGQYEGLKEEIETNPERTPDYGPAKLGTAGATVIGARVPLVAYNVFLATDDVGIAQKIAKRIRFSSGGLPCIKALGMLVGGQAQVSMNLTDYTQTGVHTVVDLIRQEAAKHGVEMDRSELIGLIPQQAMIDAAAHYLQLPDFKPEQVLEQRIQQALLEAGE